MDSIVRISYCLSTMLDAITALLMTTLSFSKTLVHLVLKTVQLQHCRTLNFFSPKLWPRNCTVQSLTPLTEI